MQRINIFFLTGNSNRLYIVFLKKLVKLFIYAVAQFSIPKQKSNKKTVSDSTFIKDFSVKFNELNYLIFVMSFSKANVILFPIR